jgi:steroid delta-isomerase-like uncharacterized protein
MKNEFKSHLSSPKEIANAYTHTVWNAKNIDIIDQYVHQDVLIHSLLGDFRGTKAMKQVVQTWLNGFHDLHVYHELIIAENDLVSIQWRAKGTHQGEFKGRKATGKSVSYRGVTVYRIKNDKITEYWAYIDMQHLLSQIE